MAVGKVVRWVERWRSRTNTQNDGWPDPRKITKMMQTAAKKYALPEEDWLAEKTHTLKLK